MRTTVRLIEGDKVSSCLAMGSTPISPTSVGAATEDAGTPAIRQNCEVVHHCGELPVGSMADSEARTRPGATEPAGGASCGPGSWRIRRPGYVATYLSVILMMAKIKLDEACPCGSGRLYQDCHLPVRRDQRPPVEITKRYPLNVIDEPEPGTQTVLEKTGPGPIFAGSEISVAFTCGSCGDDLIVGVPAESIVDVVLRCGTCQSYNESQGCSIFKHLHEDKEIEVVALARKYSGELEGHYFKRCRLLGPAVIGLVEENRLRSMTVNGGQFWVIDENRFYDGGRADATVCNRRVRAGAYRICCTRGGSESPVLLAAAPHCVRRHVGDFPGQLGYGKERPRPAGAENLIHAAQAACSYSWMMPPRRSRRRMSSRAR
jgi:hypothetical protein